MSLDSKEALACEWTAKVGAAFFLGASVQDMALLTWHPTVLEDVFAIPLTAQ